MVRNLRLCGVAAQTDTGESGIPAAAVLEGEKILADLPGTTEGPGSEAEGVKTNMSIIRGLAGTAREERTR